MRDQRRDGSTNWVQTYFEWKIFFIVARVLGAIGVGGVIFGWFVVYEVAPDYGTAYLEWVLGLMVLAMPVLVGVGIYQACRKRPDPLKGWAPAGALINPPEPWLDDSGNRLWVRVGDRWERAVLPQRDK